MELFECHSPLNRINKALGVLKKEYGVMISEGTINQTIERSQRKMNWMRNELKDNAKNPEWVKESLIYATATDIRDLFEAEQSHPTQRQYRIDPKTGAILDFNGSALENAGNIGERPDLWYHSSSPTDARRRILPPYASFDDEEIADLDIDESDLAANNATGIYVGVNTPGSQGATVNAEKGASKVKVANMKKHGVIKTTTKKQKASDGDINNKMIFNKGEADSKITNVGSPISGQKEKQMKEGLNRSSMQRLMESEIEKAQIVMAVQNEIVEKLQRDAEKIANMKIDILGPIVERIKAEHGLEAAEAFRDTIQCEIDQALDIVMQVKDRINTETLKLTGDLSSAPSIEQDLGAEEPMGAFDFEDEFSTDEPELEPLPAEREVKESRKLGIVVESVKGTMGKKFFENVEQMRSWAKENKDKIAKIHKII